MDTWYYADRKGQRQGPLSASALAGLFRGLEVDAQTLVWREGLAEWQPLGAFMDELGLSVAPEPPPLALPRQDGAAPGTPMSSRPAADLATQTAAGHADSIVYAGFWRRYLALMVDQLVLVIPLLVLLLGAAFMFGLLEQTGEDDTGIFELLYFGIYLVIAPLYYALQESSRHQATLGKRALGIKVTDLHGNRLGFGRALGRWFASALSYLTLYLGFVMAAFTLRKQALHDLVASTLVTDRWAFTDHPERQKRGLSGCLVAVLVVLVAGVPVLAILAAIALPAYRDYTIRSHVAQAIATATPLKQLVTDFHATTGTCPTNGEGAIQPPAAYATAQVRGIDTGSMEEGGRCAIQVTLRRESDEEIDGKRLWLEREASDGSWRCSSEVDDRFLPSDCRG